MTTDELLVEIARLCPHGDVMLRVMPHLPGLTKGACYQATFVHDDHYRDPVRSPWTGSVVKALEWLHERLSKTPPRFLN